MASLTRTRARPSRWSSFAILVRRQIQMRRRLARMRTDFAQLSHLTFDCYGTLIDWERGIISCLLTLLSSSGVNPQPVEILRQFVRHESALEAGPWQPYRDILKQVCRNIATDFNILLSESECEKLPNSLADWPLFPDTVTALEQLKRRFRLVILSNTDDDLFARTAARLVVPFDEVITAQQLRSYKPATAHFVEAPRRLGVPISRILHVAQSLFHDHAPAKRLGYRTAWINRTSILPHTGLPPAAIAKPDMQFSSLAGLAAALASTKNAGAASPCSLDAAPD